MSGMGEAPLGGPKIAPRNIQSALSMPLQNDHLPDRRKPPLSGLAMPPGAKLDADSVFGLSQYSCWNCSG
jgi:hypothetical protein